MALWSSFLGMLKLELTSAEPASALAEINQQGIPVYRVVYVGDLTVRFCIQRSHYRKLQRTIKRRGDALSLCGREGVYWGIRALLARPVMILGICFLFLCALYVPTRVLFLRVEGNNRVPARQIISAAEEVGIRFWASRREVRSEKIKNALLSAVPELQWAGVNTKGCVAVISVRERTLPEETKERAGVSGIVACRDGVVESCTVIRGSLLCSPGQAVKTGQTLISGYTDCGLYLQATQAEGEVYALTRRQLCVITPGVCTTARETETVKKKYSLLIGKKRINLWKDSGIWDTSCGRMYSEYYVTLPGGFSLPVALAVDTYVFRETEDSAMEITQYQLSKFARQYLEGQMVAGIIKDSIISFSKEENAVYLTGSYICSEMIGRVQQEQIGEIYVEND